MPEIENQADVMELCMILQCLGFNVKSLDTSDANFSQEGGSNTRNVVINCQASGLHVVLESVGLSCSCPANNLQNSGFWQVSGVAGGKQRDKESGSTALGSLPKTARDRVTKELLSIVQYIRENHEVENVNKSKDNMPLNKSSSMVEINTPNARDRQECGTPMYRSLDTLTGKEPPGQLPEPGLLQKGCNSDLSTEDTKAENMRAMCSRQSTYTVSSVAGSVIRRRNKTSSPIQTPQCSILDNLVEVEKEAEKLRSKLAAIIRDFVDEDKHDSSVSSLALDVSKISVLKGAETSKAQFASSPNLSAIGSAYDDFAKNRLNRLESVSTSHLAMKKSTPISDGTKVSKLRRLSPKFFSTKKENHGTDKNKVQDNKASKLQNLFRPKIVTPVRGTKPCSETNINLSSTKKKFSHVKSTIPRPSIKKE